MVGFLARLRDVRDLAGLTWSDLARICGAPRTYFSQLERLGTDASLSRVAAAAATLGASLDYLVLGQGQAPSIETVRAAVAVAQRDPEKHRRAIEHALRTHRFGASLHRRVTRHARRAKPLRLSDSPAVTA